MRHTQLLQLKEKITEKYEEEKDVSDARIYHNKAVMSFANIDGMIEQLDYKKGIYLLCQGCWNLGYAYSALKRL